MENENKIFTLPRKVLPIITVALAVLLVVVVWFLSRDKAPDSSAPAEVQELVVESVTPQGSDVVVATTYGTVKYPYAFSDIMSVEAKNFGSYAALEFSAKIGEKSYKLYDLLFNSEEGSPLGTLEYNGETYTVTAQFHGVSNIDDNHAVTFYAAQETLNDVASSLAENENFTAEN